MSWAALITTRHNLKYFSDIPSPRLNGERVRVRGRPPSDWEHEPNMRGPQPWKTNRSRVLRSNATSAESKLWFHIRDGKLGGFKFVRQFPIENYFVDFACRKARLIVEIDGSTHGTPAEIANDIERSQIVSGYKIVRFHNTDVYHHIEAVLDQLLAMLNGRNA